MQCAFPAQSPVGELPMMYAAPTAGTEGGSLRSYSAPPATSTSKVCKLSLKKNSFCACPGLKKGRDSRGVALILTPYVMMMSSCSAGETAKSPTCST